MLPVASLQATPVARPMQPRAGFSCNSATFDEIVAFAVENDMQDRLFHEVVTAWRRATYH